MSDLRNYLHQPVSSKFEDNLKIIAAHTALSLQARAHRKGTQETRRREIKSRMIDFKWSNGKASAYSKLVEHLISTLTGIHGVSKLSAKSSFWDDWEQMDTEKRFHRVHAELFGFMTAKRINTIVQLCRHFKVRYGNSQPPFE